MTYDELLMDINNKKISPVYLLMGEEPFFIDQIADILENSIIEPADRDFNQVVLYGKDTDSAEILSNVKQFPFGSTYRVVIVKEAKDLKDIDNLKSYVSHPASSSVLVICYKYAKLKAAQYKPFEKSGTVFVSDPIKDSKLPAWVQTQAAKHSFKLNSQAANIITEHIGNDLSRINNEFLKLKIILPANTEITPDIIEKNIGISKEYNIFELQNALGERNIPKASKIVNNFILYIKDNPNVRTISMLYSFYSKMLSYHLAPDKSPETLKRIYGSIHPYALDINIKYAQRHSVMQLRKIMATLHEFDVKSKGVDNVASEESILKELIYKVLY